MLPHAVSYDAFVTPDENKRMEVFLRDNKSEGQETKVFKSELRLILHSALTGLPRRERFIIERRFGLKDDRNLTLEAISKTLQLSKERVRQLEQEALEKLRGALQDLQRELLAA